MGGGRRAGHLENGVPSTKWIGHGLQGERIGNVLAVDHKAVFVFARRQRRFLPPMPDAGGMEGFAFRLPVVERSRDTNRGGGRVRELKANRL